MTITARSYASLYPSLSFSDLYDPFEDAPAPEIQSSVPEGDPDHLPEPDFP